jgi:hypothetical protein
MMPTMHRLNNRRSYLFPLLLAALCLPPSIFANTITIVSGNGSIGSPDPVVQVSTDSGATYNPATIITANPNYNVIPGTQWLAFNSSGFGLQNTDMLFRVPFTLPAGFSSPQLSLSVFADNVATSILNGVIFGGQPFIQDAINFTNPPSVFTTSNPGLFQVGQNFLTVYLYNFTDPSGVDFKATITFVPEPSTFLLVGSSLLGGLFMLKKRPTSTATKSH